MCTYSQPVEWVKAPKSAPQNLHRALSQLSHHLRCFDVFACARVSACISFPKKQPTQNKTHTHTRTKRRPEFSHQIIPRDMRQTTLLLVVIYELFTRCRTRAQATYVACASRRRQFAQKLTYFCQTSGLFGGARLCACVNVSVIVVLN